MVMRYVFRHIPRALAKSLLSLLLAAALIASLGQFITVVRTNRALVDEMYDTVEVLANVVNRSGITGGGVHYEAIDLLVELDFASSYYAEADGPCYWMPPKYDEDTAPEDMIFYTSDAHEIYSTTDPVRLGKTGTITYAEGYDASSFLTETRSACFISDAALAEYGLEYGDRIFLSGVDVGTRGRAHESEHGGVPFTIIGSFDSSGGAGSLGTMLGDYDVITPFWSMRNIYRSYYLTYLMIGSFPDAATATFAEFRVRNDLLRDESAYKDAPNDALESSPYGNISIYALRVLDDEVQNVIKPLDENTDLLELLLPVICTVVLIIGAAIPGLVIIMSSREAAIMRVLGTPKSKVRAILLIEQMLLCLAGLVLGVVGLMAAHGFGDVMRHIDETLLYATGYALLAAVICFACAVSVSAKKPLALLQAKE